MRVPASPLALVDTEYCADSIEWCPFEGFQDILICGTYQLLQPEKNKSELSAARGDHNGSDGSDGSDDDDDDDDVEEAAPVKTERTGRVLVYQLEEDHASLKEIQRIDTAAILDSKWSPKLEEDGSPLLAVADAKGSIKTYTLDSETKRLSIKDTIPLADEDTLCLSLDWSNRRDPSSSSPSFIVSLSNGCLSHVVLCESSWEISNTWKAHDYEPWITSFDYWDSEIVWSGGDDCKLKCWDLRDTSMPVMVNSKVFEGGVTTITSSPHTPNLLAVGSYDQRLRLFDSRNIKTPVLTIPTNGGIWRTRFHPSPSRAGDILLACMQGGFQVVRLDNTIIGGNNQDWSNISENSWTEISSFTEKSSLGYGADWSRLPPSEDNTSVIGTCSFYDHTMHLWRS